ncbi:MAG: hypothetical protein QW645_02050 [Candidatus Bathyarchaeia archaeon]
MPIAGKTRSGWASEILKFPREVSRSTAFVTMAPRPEALAPSRISSRRVE